MIKRADVGAGFIRGLAEGVEQRLSREGRLAHGLDERGRDLLRSGLQHHVTHSPRDEWRDGELAGVAERLVYNLVGRKGCGE